MSRLEISKIADSGEHCWGVSLIDDNEKLIFQNTTPLAKGAALSIAKTLKHKGFDAPLVWKPREDSNTPAWVVEKMDDSWLIRFTLVKETSFDLQLKLEDEVEDTKIIESAFEMVRSDLAKAEITWTPPEADPAYEEKESDCTETQGHAGS